MRLTRFSDIGLRVLMYLARVGEQRVPPTVAEIATQFGIPRNHLVKVVGQLAQLGWIQTIKGRNGGIRLQTHPEQLRIGTILRELEGRGELVDCDGQDCRLRVDCKLRGAMAVGQRAFYDAMDGFTIKDMSSGTTGEQIVRIHRDFLAASGQAGATQASA